MSSQQKKICIFWLETSFKHKLQEFTVKNGKPLPIYNTIEVSNDHPPQFRSKVWVGFEYMIGSTHHIKKKAEQAATKLAYKCLSKYAAKELLLSIRNS
ncbi:hypothetical protein A4A49_52500 [Nicotiana attenuata]|uniref:DRBM domain-containing protein n=1 Tax=Nicotiana attenuata TaxID=49451 RepID=A0A314LEE9_NICAT|nr:hypothetical protein A4A49_52500 [Nicotiana attenuata]